MSDVPVQSAGRDELSDVAIWLTSAGARSGARRATRTLPNPDSFFHNLFSMYDGKRLDPGL